MTGVAVKVKEVPDAAGLVPAVKVMVAEGATEGFTVIVMTLDVAVVVVTQAKLEVMMHFTVWPLVNVVVVYVALLVPTLALFTCH